MDPSPLLEKNEKEEEHVEEEESDDEDLEERVGNSFLVFTNNLGMATRTAFACVICSLPVFIPSIYHPIPERYSGLIGSGLVLMVVFTVYANLGVTIQQAWQGFIGTLLACVPTHVLCALMPKGAAEQDTYNGTLVHTVNVIVIFLGLFLNISKNTRMFLVCYHVYFIMDFMNPTSMKTEPSIYNKNWAIDLNANTTATMITTCVGLVVAAFVMVFPRPVRAIRACRDQAKDTVDAVTGLVDALVEYYAGSEPSVRIVRSEVAAVKLRNTIGGMQTNISAAWWETFDFGRAGCSRALLQRHATMLKGMADTIFSLQICVAKEDFGPTHVQIMEKISPQVGALKDATSKLLRDSTYAAIDGGIDDKERENMENGCDSVKRSITELAEAFDAARKDICPDKRICADLQAESFFGYGLSSYARRTLDYARELIDHPPKICTPEVPFLHKAWWDAFVGIFDRKVIIDDPDMRSFTIRNSLSVIIAFYWGYFCDSYNAVPAGTIAVLISNFAGSALQKNLGRLQGVTLAQILPHMLVQVMGSPCSPMQIIGQCSIIAAWEIITCYIFYSSPSLGYIGMLLAAFGVGPLVIPCTHPTDTGTAEKDFGTATFTKIVSTTIAVIIMTMVDLLLASTTAAMQATDDYTRALLTIDAQFQACIVPRRPNGEAAQGHIEARLGLEVPDRTMLHLVANAAKHRTPGTILRYLGSASALGEEADKEPRYHKAPWPMDFFTSLVRTGYILRANLNEFEHVLQRPDGTLDDVFANCRDMEGFQKIKADVFNTMNQCLSIVNTVLRNDTGKPLPSVLLQLDSLEKIDKLEDIGELMDAINASDAPELAFPEQVQWTLEQDLLCRLNVALMVMDSTIANVASIIKACIKQLV